MTESRLKSRNDPAEDMSLLDWWEREREALQSFALAHVGEAPRPVSGWHQAFMLWRLNR